MLKFLPIRSFKKKLLFLIWAGSTATLFLVCSLFIFLEISQFNKDLTKHIRVISNFIAEKSAPAIMLNDPAIAEYALLSAVKTEPAIIHAVIYDIKDNVIATYVRSNPDSKKFSIPAPKRNVIFLNNGHLHFFSDISMYSDRIGTVYIRVERHELYKRIQRYGIIVVGIMAVSLLLMTFLSFFLQKFILTPVTALISSAKKVAEKKDYTIRIKKHYNDELGVLVDTFNEMLEQIQKRDEELRESQGRLKIILESSPNPVIMYNREGHPQYLSPSFTDLFGWTPEELEGSTIPFVPEFDKASSMAKIKTIYETGASLIYKTKRLTKDGRLLDVILSAACIQDAFGKGISTIVNFTDITKTKRLETQLQQAQKMEAIGTLAGGIAHDFNNILAAILGYTELAISDLDQESDKKKELDQVLSATYRATELVDQILTFSRKSEQKLIPLRIQSVIRDSLKLLRPSIPSTIQIKNSIDPKCENVIANPTQIHQVIMNLCTNAYHAMRETGGILGISLQPIVITDEYLVDVIDLQPGHYLKLEVSDTGTGIPKDIQEKIFDPYFTTKTKEGGTGLGLAVVHGIVKSLHGDITINSEPGCGTKFHVFLPVTKTMGKMVLAKNTESIPTGIERILLVDDDKNLLQMNKKILQGLGYRVTAFMSSPEAFETFSKTPDSFDLVITDMTMPNITGAELAGQIFEINPDMPIILCTGYSELINPEKADSLGIQGYVSKPVLKRELANIIRKVLDKNKKNS